MNNTFYDENDEIEIDLRELLFALKKRCLIVIASGLFLGGAAFLCTKFLMTPVYTSTASMLVLTKETTLSSLADLQMGTQLTKDYEVLITSRPVLEEVIEKLRLDMDYKVLERLITIENPEDTRILEVSVEYESAETARDIVNELADVSSEFIGDMMEGVPPKLIEDGEAAATKTRPSTTKNTALGLLAGILLSAGAICLMTVMDDTIKTEDDVSRYLGISTLASIPDRKDYISGKTGSRRKKKKRTKKTKQEAK